MCFTDFKLSFWGFLADQVNFSSHRNVLTLTSSSLLRWADIRLTSWPVVILSKTLLESFRVWNVEMSGINKGTNVKVNWTLKSQLVRHLGHARRF